MGLDILELFMETEEAFGISIPDAEAANARTVGDLYRITLAKLDIPYQPAQLDAPYRHRAFVRSSTEPWTTPEVWATLRNIISSQLQVEEDDVREDASFQNDLGAD